MIRKVRALPVAAALTLTLLLAVPAAAGAPRGGTAPAGDLPPPGSVTIDHVLVNGNGCPRSTIRPILSPDQTALLLESDNEVRVQVGGSAKPGDARKNCQVSLGIRPPQGYQFAVRKAEHEGHAGLAAGASATLRMNFYFAGGIEQSTISHRFSGPLLDFWETVGEVPVAGLIWSPCNIPRNLNINTTMFAQIGTSDPAVTSYLAVATTSGTARPLFTFAWRRCP